MTDKEETLTRKDVIDIVVERMKAVSARTSMSQAPNQVYQHQADATISQESPMSATEYTILDTTKNVRVISVNVVPTYTGTDDANDNCKVIITIDGQTLTYTVAGTAMITATNYHCEVTSSLAPASQLLGTTDQAPGRPFLLEGRSVKIVALVTDGGTSNVTFTNLTARVKYAKIP